MIKRIAKYKNVVSLSIFYPEKYLLYILFVAVPFEGYVAFWVKNYPISIPFAISLLLFFLLFLKVLLLGKLYFDKILLSVLMLIFSAVISIFAPIIYELNFQEYLRSLAYALYFPALFILASQIRLNQKELRRFLWFIIFIGIIISIIGIYQAIANNTSMGLPNLYFNLTSSITGYQRQYAFGTAGIYLRPTSIFAEPSWFGHYLVFIIFISLLLYKKILYNHFIWLLIVVNILALILTLSFGCYLALIGAFLISYFLTFRSNFNLIFKILFIFILICGVTFITFPELVNRLVPDFLERTKLDSSSLLEGFHNRELPSLSQGSILIRFSSSWAGLLLCSYSPVTFLFGWGIGEFQTVVQNSYDWAGPAFCGTGWANILIEQGIFGLIFYLVFFTTILLSIKCIRRKNIRNLEIFALLALLFFFIISGFTGGIGFERSMTFWCLIMIFNIIRHSLIYNFE
jgi:hypothetical protein